MKIKNVLSLFDGISCGQVALHRAGIEFNNYYASELDKFPIKVTQANYPGTIQLGDVCGWKDWDIDWGSIDLLIGGSPCQGFSFAGKQLAFDDPRSKLFFVYADILNHIKKHNPNVKFLLENVRMKKEFLDVISDHLGVDPVFINSDRFVPQNRPRGFWFNWTSSETPERPNWDLKFYQWRRTYFRENKSGVCPCLTANMGTGGHNVPLKSKDLKDKLTVNECCELQSLPAGYCDSLSKTQAYKAIGNGWTVDVIAHIFEGLKNE